MVKLVLLPAVSSQEDLGDLLARVGWYLYPFRAKISDICIWLDDVDPEAVQIPGRFASDCERYAELVRLLFRFSEKTAHHVDEVRQALDESAAVFVWRTSDPVLFDPAIAASVRRLKSAGRYFDVDPVRTRMEGSFYLWAGLKVFEQADELAEQNRTRFESFLSTIGRNQRAYVFGTGPSLSGFAADHDFSDGVCFASNSMVKNEALLNRLKPAAVIAADPIFHAGCSRYAEAFRNQLVRVMRAHNTHFITSLRDYSVFASYLPKDLRSKVIGVPFNGDEPFNPDLSRSFHVKPLANILTLLLLPLAGATADEICIVGCDGRPLDQNQYFWTHDKAVQFNDEMDNIKLVHPAFFKANYDEYYEEHCKNVEIAVSELESIGKAVKTLTPSYIPALSARHKALVPSGGGDVDKPRLDSKRSRPTNPLNKTRLRFVAIDPDGRNGSGHFFSHDTRLYEAAKNANIDFTLLARADIDDTALPSDMRVIKCLSVHSWDMGTAKEGNRAPQTAQFIEELSQALRSHFDDAMESVVLYGYCGSLEHAFAISSVLAKFEHIRAHVTLFWQFSAPYGDVRYLNQWRPHIAAMVSNPRLTLSVPTKRIQSDLQAHFGISPVIAPHPSTTFSDEEAKKYSQQPIHRIANRPVILFPGGARKEKGADLTASAIPLLSAEKSFDLIVRANPDNAKPEPLETLNAVSGDHVTVFREPLNDHQFREFLASGDIIVCPYLESAFAGRTSGLVIDAMILGRPIVALKNTWLGELAEREAFGVAADVTAEGIAIAVRTVAARFDEFSAGAAQARKRYIERHSWTELVTAIIDGASFDQSRKASTLSNCAEEDRQAAIAQMPPYVRSQIFLPTDRLPIDQQVEGINRAAQLYKSDLDQIYRPKLQALKAARRKDRCWIIGNGPSLKNTDLLRLQGEDTFVTNGFFLKLPELDWAPTYYVVEDHLVAEDRAHEINLLRGFTKLFPANLRYVLNPDPNTTFFDHRPRKSFPHGFDFSFDADGNTYAGGTVTFTCMQLAAYLGYTEIYLVGVDASYAIPADALLSGGGRVKEIDMKSDDTNHFHPDYFGKGKRWHEPNVDVMIRAYEEAKRACDGRGVKIFNATKGGKLEVFPRVKYDAVAPFRMPLTPAGFPRVLVIDMTRIGDATATGELKATLFRGWPADRLMQIFDCGYGELAIVRNGAIEPLPPPVAVDDGRIAMAVADFKPDIILYRPTPKTTVAHGVAMHLIENLALPLVTWIMDDWPTALATSKRAPDRRLLEDWHRLVRTSNARLCISEPMAEAFLKRYGQKFVPVSNGIDPKEWRAPAVRPTEGPLRVRYAGSLAKNMTLATVHMVARAVEQLSQRGVDIVFEIKTRELWKELAAPKFGGLKHTHFVVEDLDAPSYRNWLSEADIVVIGYNFDEESKEYVRYSLANKMPECLASGAPLLAVGPSDVTTMSMLDALDCGVRIRSPDLDKVSKALQALSESAELRQRLGKAGQDVAFKSFSLSQARFAMMKELSMAAAAGVLNSLQRGLPRSAGGHVDETAVVARLLSARTGRSHAMLDVGAHYGTSASYFHKLDWRIFCFEPDEKNREALSAKYRDAPNVFIDPRAVSDEAKTSVAFYTSPESTGISTLGAFRDTHQESARVDVTTIASAIEQHQLTTIDFLKIDVEGFDFSVLKGVPWEKTKPDVIECEFEDAKTVRLGHTWRDLANFLRAKRYAVYISEWHPIIRYGIRHDWRRIVPLEKADLAPDSWGNILAFVEDPGLAALTDAFRCELKTRPATAPAAAAALKPNPAARVGTDVAQSGGRQEDRPPRFYARSANRLKARAPRIFAALRFGKQVLASIWGRRTYTAPAAFAFVAWMSVGLFFPTVRWPIWGIGAFAFLLSALAYVAVRMHLLMERVTAKNELLHQHLEGTRAELTNTRARLASVAEDAARLSQAEDNNKKAIAGVRARLAQESQQLAALEHSVDSRLADRDAANNESFAKLHAGLADRETATNQLAADLDARVKTADEIAARRAEALGADVQRAEAELSERIAQVDKAATFNNASWYQRFNRRLNETQIETLKKWAEPTPLKANDPAIGYAAHRACLVEARMSGRLATSIEDVLLRATMAMRIKRASVNVLEIGTLFGIGAGIMYDAIAPHFDNVHFTLIDPLDGYYGARNLDVLTGQPISEETLRRNLAEVALGGDNLTIIKHLSTDAEAIELASARKYDVIVIDGDHSYAGVKADFDLYTPMLRQGGIVIFDDYSSPHWPEVQAYVDAEVAPLKTFELVGHEWRTCVYRFKGKARRTKARGA